LLSLKSFFNSALTFGGSGDFLNILFIILALSIYVLIVEYSNGSALVSYDGFISVVVACFLPLRVLLSTLGGCAIC
jgi:hypothetical protein